MAPHPDTQQQQGQGLVTVSGGAPVVTLGVSYWPAVGGGAAAPHPVQSASAEAGTLLRAAYSPPGCYPFYKTDPFIFLECPHVYFCGNTPSFGSKIIQGNFCLLGAQA